MTLRERASMLLRTRRRNGRDEDAGALATLIARQDALATQLTEMHDLLERRVTGSADDIIEQVVAGSRQAAARIGQASASDEKQLAGLRDELAGLRDELGRLRDDVWASKVVRVGDRLLVGSRHLNLVFLLEADDRLIVPRFVVDGEYEPATTAFLKQLVQPDSVCVDVGANFGYYTCLLGHLAWHGRTIAYEADPQMYALLATNVDINWCSPVVTAINAAVAAEPGELTLHRWAHRSGNSGIIRPEDLSGPGTDPTSEAFTVGSVALDSLVGELARVDVVKIDVEGAEHLVVAGMAKFMAHFRPTVVLEWSPTQMVAAGSSPAELAAAISEWDVDVSTIGPGGSLAALDAGTLPELAYQNIVLRPR